MWGFFANLLKTQLRPFQGSLWISKRTSKGLDFLAFPCAPLSEIRISGLLTGLKCLKVVFLLCYLCDTFRWLCTLCRSCWRLRVHLSVRDVVLFSSLLCLQKETTDEQASGCKDLFFFSHRELEWIMSTEGRCCWHHAAVEQCASWCGLCHICLACSCLNGVRQVSSAAVVILALLLATPFSANSTQSYLPYFFFFKDLGIEGELLKWHTAFLNWSTIIFFSNPL